MKLQEKMDTYKEQMQAQAPKEALDIMQSATKELGSSRMLEDAIKIGDKAPGFSLENTSNTLVTMDSLLSQGPLVLAFFRGKW